MKKSFVEPKERPYHSLQTHTLQSMHEGFNYFHEIDLSFSITQPKAKSLLRKRSSTIKTENSTSNQDEIKQMLDHNKIKLFNLKTEIQSVREYQFNDYIKKSLRYQQLLSINDTKKKRLPTLNVKVGEVVKKALFDQQKNYQYDATFMDYKVQGWKPQLRQGHTCIAYKDNIIVIGGHCSYPFSAINIFSIQNNVWLKGFQGGSARSYHTSLLYRSRFVINFGGMGIYNPARKCRQCFNSINLIDLSAHSSKIIKIQNQELIEPRRSHAAILMGKHMVVFGGMNTKKQYLNDLVYLDLKELRWYHKEYTILDEHFQRFISSGLAKHQGITCFKPRKKYPLYSADYSEYEGIYLFGGYNQQGQDNVVSQITFNRYIPVLKRINYIGAPPSPKDPLLQKFNECTIVIVSGDQYQRQLNLFKVKEQKFIEVTYNQNGNKIMLGGLGSALVHYKNNYFMFYGLGKNGYIDTIGSFNLIQTVKETQAKKKKKSMHGQWRNFFQTIHSKTDSRTSLSQGIDQQYGFTKSRKK